MPWRQGETISDARLRANALILLRDHPEQISQTVGARVVESLKPGASLEEQAVGALQFHRVFRARIEHMPEDLPALWHRATARRHEKIAELQVWGPGLERLNPLVQNLLAESRDRGVTLFDTAGALGRAFSRVVGASAGDPHGREQFLSKVINDMLVRGSRLSTTEAAVRAVADPALGVAEKVRAVSGLLALSVGSTFATGGGNIVFGLISLATQAGVIRTIKGSDLLPTALMATFGGTLGTAAGGPLGGMAGAGAGAALAALKKGPGRIATIGIIPGINLTRGFRRMVRETPAVRESVRSGAQRPFGMAAGSREGVPEVVGGSDALNRWRQGSRWPEQIKSVFAGVIQAHETYLRGISSEVMTKAANDTLRVIESNPARFLTMKGFDGRHARMLDRLMSGRQGQIAGGVLNAITGVVGGGVAGGLAGGPTGAVVGAGAGALAARRLQPGLSARTATRRAPGLRTIREVVRRGGFTDREMDVIRQNGVGLTQFFSVPSGMPIDWTGPLGKLFTQFWAMAYRQSVQTIGTVLEETGHGNLAPAMRFVIAGIAGGLTYDEMNDVLSGRDLNPRAQSKWSAWIDIIGPSLGILDRPLGAVGLQSRSPTPLIDTFTPYTVKQASRFGQARIDVTKGVGAELTFLGTGGRAGDPEGFEKAGAALTRLGRTIPPIRLGMTLQQHLAPTDPQRIEQFRRQLNVANRNIAESVEPSGSFLDRLRPFGANLNLVAPTLPQARESLRETIERAPMKALAERGTRRIPPESAEQVRKRLGAASMASARGLLTDRLEQAFRSSNAANANAALSRLFAMGADSGDVVRSLRNRSNTGDKAFFSNQRDAVNIHKRGLFARDAKANRGAKVRALLNDLIGRTRTVVAPDGTQRLIAAKGADGQRVRALLEYAREELRLTQSELAKLARAMRRKESLLRLR